MRDGAQIKTTLSAFQTIALTSSSYFPLVFWFYPGIAVQYARFDAQWAVLGVVLLSLFMAWLHGAMSERFPDMTGVDPALIVFGRALGKFVVAVYVPVYVAFVGTSTYFFILLVRAFFPTTPEIVLLFFIYVVAWRGAWMGVETLGRVAAIIHSGTFAGMIGSFVAVILTADRHWMPYKIASVHHVFNGIYHLFPLYLGFDLFLMLSPYYPHRKGRSIWFPVISAAVGGLVILLAFVADVTNLGWLSTTKLMFPLQFSIQLIRMQGWIVERLGIVILILSTAFETLFLSNHINAVSMVMARLFNRSEHRFHPFTFLIAPAMFAVAVSFRNGSDARAFVDHMLTPASWVVLLGIPIIKLGVGILRGKRTDTSGPQHQRSPTPTD